MLEGARQTLEWASGRRVVKNTFFNDIEFAIVFNSGRVFYTGGFDDMDSIDKILKQEKNIAGSYSPNPGAWCVTAVNPINIESIIDLRTDTSEEEK